MEIFVLDGHEVPSPEDMAMLQALYSRSPQSVQVHLEKVKQVGSGKFMDVYYTGYGHRSIADCGTITLCIENVSMLCAKAIQDNPLYNGQEASTRYLDFGSRPMVDPVGTPESAKIQSAWIGLYNQILPKLIEHFEQRFPREEGQKQSVWKKAVKARAFDVARGFLPAGCTTFVAWHQNLRQIHDHLSLMRQNPSSEIREVADRVHEEVLKRYPSSFGHKRYAATDDYLAASAAAFAFTDRDTNPEFEVDIALDLDGLRRHQNLLETRPPKTELHKNFRAFGQMQFRFPLDFGSYRDLQRHRSCVQEMPLLTTRWGFLPWYIEQLPEEVKGLVDVAGWKIAEQIDALDCSPEHKQYYIAMGFACPIQITCSLPSAIYIAELRSGTTVHPTVRKVAQQMGEAVKAAVPGIAMHHDMGESVWDIKRGTQDIVKA